MTILCPFYPATPVGLVARKLEKWIRALSRSEKFHKRKSQLKTSVEQGKSNISALEEEQGNHIKNFQNKTNPNQISHNIYPFQPNLYNHNFAMMDITQSTSVRTSIDNSSDSNDDASCGKKRVRDDLTEDERREERKAANRRSAFQSRLRKKLLIEELQQKVNKLQEEMAVLKENNRTLTLGLEASLSENRRLRFMQQHGSSSGGMAALAGLQGMGGMAGMSGMGGASAHQNVLLGLGGGGGFGSLLGGGL